MPTRHDTLQRYLHIPWLVPQAERRPTPQDASRRLNSDAGGKSFRSCAGIALRSTFRQFGPSDNRAKCGYLSAFRFRRCVLVLTPHWPGTDPAPDQRPNRRRPARSLVLVATVIKWSVCPELGTCLSYFIIRADPIWAAQQLGQRRRPWP